MFVAVMIGRGQFVVDLESGRKRRQGQKDAHQGQGEAPSDHQARNSGEETGHRILELIKELQPCQSIAALGTRTEQMCRTSASTNPLSCAAFGHPTDRHRLDSSTYFAVR
jgi:hypothetical protein